MKCPYCNSELRTFMLEESVVWYCPNRCAPMLPPKIWQALIDGKKAQDALKGIEIRVAAIRSCVQDGYTQIGERNRNIFIALELFKDLIKEITSITKQEE